MHEMRSIRRAVESVRERLTRACERAGRDPAAVRLVAVSKGVSPERVVEAVHAGIEDVGENRAQELRDKAREVDVPVRWHFVGAIQTNKVRYLDPVELVHGVDREAEAAALDARAERTGRVWDALIEVNVVGERAKQGVAPGDLGAFLERISSYPRIRTRGLMIMAPRAEKVEDVRWVFAEARRLRDRFRGEAGGLEELSMGMSRDFEVAVEEGSTLVRIGSAIFREE